MPTDPRDELWLATYETWYDSYYEELLAEALVARWLCLDEFIKIAVAVTTTASAIAAVAFWKQTNFIWLWPVLSGIAALFAISTEKLAISYKLRDHGDTMRSFSSLRIDIDTLRSRMKINPNFDIDVFESEYLSFRKRFGDNYQRVKSDMLLTKKMQRECQTSLDARIG